VKSLVYDIKRGTLLENRELRRKFETKREEVIGAWRKLYE
jgi:hypothetical protein